MQQACVFINMRSNTLGLTFICIINKIIKQIVNSLYLHIAKEKKKKALFYARAKEEEEHQNAAISLSGT